MRFVKRVLPVLCLMLATIFISQMLFTSMMEHENERCWEELQMTAEAKASDIRTKFNGEFAKLYLFGRQMCWNNILDIDSLERLHLEELKNNTFFSQIHVLYPDGTLALNGKKSELRYDAFEELANKGTFVSNRQKDAVTGRLSVYYILPVKQEGNTVAILIGVMDVDLLMKFFSVNGYNGKANAYIIDSTNGTIVLGSGSNEWDEPYRMPTLAKSAEYQGVEFAAENLEGGVLQCSVPVYISDWEVVVSAPAEEVFSGLLYIKRVVTVAGIAVYLLLLIYMAWNIRMVEQLESSNYEIQIRQKWLEMLSYTDALTSIYNRNKYLEVLKNLGEREREKIGFVYIDLNGLKKINDTQLHDAGDRYIQSAARILREVFGENCYRIGGDEFVVLVSGIEEENFSESLKRMRQRADEEQVSFSVGAIWRDRCECISELLRDAEEKMYYEKKEYYTNHDRRKS